MSGHMDWALGSPYLRGVPETSTSDPTRVRGVPKVGSSLGFRVQGAGFRDCRNSESRSASS